LCCKDGRKRLSTSANLRAQVASKFVKKIEINRESREVEKGKRSNRNQNEKIVGPSKTHKAIRTNLLSEPNKNEVAPARGRRNRDREEKEKEEKPP